MVLRRFLFLFILISNCALAQNLALKRAVSWTKSEQNDRAQHASQRPVFKEQSFDASYSSLPFFSESVELNIPGEYSYTVEASIQILAKSPIGSTLNAKRENVPNTIDASVFKARNKMFVTYRFCPFIANSTNGELERVDTFIINLSILKQNKKGDLVSTIKSAVLANGRWFKIAVATTGIYKIPFASLQTIGFETPSKCRIFGNPTGQLPFLNLEQMPHDLKELAIWEFQDAIYFYGVGPDHWSWDKNSGKYEYNNHQFSDQNYYFISDLAGTVKNITTSILETSAANTASTGFDYCIHHELDSLNLIKSGQKWFGEHFDVNTSFAFEFIHQNCLTNQEGIVTISTAARSKAIYTDNFIQVNLNGAQDFARLKHLPVTYSSTNDFASNSVLSTSFLPAKDTTSIILIYSKPDNYSEAWLDYVSLQVRSKLEFTRQPFFFRDSKTVGEGNLTMFEIENILTGCLLWELTDPLDVKQLNYTRNVDLASFVVSTDSLREFVFFDPSGENIQAPEFIGWVENQNLHATGQCDLLIVSASDYNKQAESIAQFHRDNGLTVTIVSPQEIYNEFSSGMPDVTAIRNFVRHLYFSQKPASRIKYLLLFGDGSYDIRPNSFDANKFILGYQSSNSLLPTESYISDDYFGLLDLGEGGAEGLLDIGIGRLPVSSVAEAETVVNKITGYGQKLESGHWRNNLLFAADDGDYNLHLDQAEWLANNIDTSFEHFNLKKVYFDAYPAEANSTNTLAKEEILRQIDQGVLLVNYTGHGSELGLGSDNVVNIGDILSFGNSDKLTTFMTATCEFSRFDNHNRTSAGELILLNPIGGGVALFSTTRKVYSTPNFIMNQNFYKYIFDPEMSFGDVMMNTKTASGTGINKRNFTLLGDPALQLAMPYNRVEIVSINDIDTQNLTDTFCSFSKVKLKGKVLDDQGKMIPTYNGVLHTKVFDQKVRSTTLGENESLAVNFEQLENTIFNGVATISQGYWEQEFILPADIAASLGNGKMSFYAFPYNGTKIACGHFSDFLMTGAKQYDLNDHLGPDINIYLGDENFVSGDQVDPNAQLIVLFSDSSGINTTGFAIGRNITAWVDNKTDEPISLNPYYAALPNSYKKGKVKLPLGPFEEGEHTIKIKAWDIANNSSEAEIEFVVNSQIEPKLSQVFNYPNPFTQNTSFYFKHNLAGIGLEVSIDIFTITGKLVRHLETQMICSSDLSDPIFWDGLDDFGNKLGRSAYYYRLKIVTEQGFTVEKIEKAVSLK